MAISKKKISALPAADSFTGLFTVGVNALNQSVKISLDWLKTAYDNVIAATTAAETATATANTAVTTLTGVVDDKIVEIGNEVSALLVNKRTGVRFNVSNAVVHDVTYPINGFSIVLDYAAYQSATGGIFLLSNDLQYGSGHPSIFLRLDASSIEHSFAYNINADGVNQRIIANVSYPSGNKAQSIFTCTANGACIYFNGVLVASINDITFMNDVFSKLILGSRRATSNIPDDGSTQGANFFQIRTFNYAMTQSDVDSFYNQGRALDVKCGDEWKINYPNRTISKIEHHLDSAVTVTNGDGYTDYTPTVVVNTSFPRFRVNRPAQIVGSEVIVIIDAEVIGGDSFRLAFVEGLEPSGNNSSIIIAERNQYQFKGKVIHSNSESVYRGNIYQSFAHPTNVGKTLRIYSYTVIYCSVIDEYRPEGLTATKWVNSGVNATPITFTNPVFTYDEPFKEKSYGNGSPSVAPVAALQEYGDITNSKIWKSIAKPNTRQFAITDWKCIN